MLHAAHPLAQDDAVSRVVAWPDVASLKQWAPSRRDAREVRIARAILAVAREEAACLAGARLVRLGARVGEDCNIDLVALECALRVLCHDTDLDRLAFHLVSCARRSLCQQCGSESISPHSGQPCPQCGSPNLELVAGDELELAFIEVERS